MSGMGVAYPQGMAASPQAHESSIAATGGIYASIGEWDGFGAPEDYSFLEATLEADSGIYATYGSFGKDFDGDYIELGYGTTVSDIDLGVALIVSDDLGDQEGGEGEALVFSIGKSF